MAKETRSSIKALEYLCRKNIAVVKAVVREKDIELIEMCCKNKIEVCNEQQLFEQYISNKIEADYIFSFYWKRIGEDILRIPKMGSINFHPGPLPEARGSGYHMAILEQWNYWGVTAHYMDAELDTGDIIKCDRFPIDESVVNYDLVRLTHEKLYMLFTELVERLNQGEKIRGTAQESGRYFSLSELEHTKPIMEGEDADSIKRKIRAFWNPPYSGAQVELQGEKYTIIDEKILRWISERL